MKHTIFDLGLIAFAFLASGAAFADQNPIMRPQPGSMDGFTYVSCRDARNMADAGISVMVTQRGRMQLLEVSEQTFFGERPIGALPTRGGVDRRNGTQVFVANGVQLVITLNSKIGEMVGFVRGTVGQVRLDHDLRCNIFNRAF